MKLEVEYMVDTLIRVLKPMIECGSAELFKFGPYR